MIKRLQKRYALSEQGAKDLVKGCLACVLQNLSFMFPVGLLFFLVNDLLNGGVPGEKIAFYVIGCVVCIGFILITTYIQYNATYFATYTESGVRRITLSFFGKKDLADLTSTIMADCTFLEQSFSHFIPELAGSIISTILISISLFVFDWRMALAALVSAILGNLIYYSMMFGRSEVMKEYMMSNVNMNSTIVEYVGGMEVIKAFNQTASSMGRFQSAVIKVRDITTKWYKHCWPFMSISQAILPSSIAFVLPVGMALISGGAVSLAELIVCILLSMAIVGSLQNFTEFWESFAVISEVQPRIQALLDMEELPEPAQPKHTDSADVQMKDVHFSYGDSEIIHGVSFSAKAGTVTAFVGPSGSGKSTLAKLIARFWDVNAGAVFVGGVDIREMSLTDLTEKISYVSQDNFLFHMSLRDNIRIGKPDATDKEVEWAAAQAGCDEFIARFPQGYDTNAGDAGARLSGGERQRLAIARAILKNAPIVILSLPTGSPPLCMPIRF